MFLIMTKYVYLVYLMETYMVPVLLLSENIHFCAVPCPWLRSYFRCLITQSKLKRELLKEVFLLSLPNEFELFEEESSSKGAYVGVAEALFSWI